jgi:hypothetical protein
MIPTEADRRQLTVMFADLVGSTALSSRLDPEDLSCSIGRRNEKPQPPRVTLICNLNLRAR